MNEANQAQSESGGMSGSALGALSKAMRDKTWDEMDDAQRMEKMREEVRYLRRLVTDQSGIIRKLTRHQHAQDGAIMAPLNNRDDEDRPRGYFYDPLK